VSMTIRGPRPCSAGRRAAASAGRPRGTARALIGRMLALLPVLLWLPAPGLAGEVTVAVAANFLEPLRAIGAEFEAATGDELVIVAGSTGQLYAQIVNGAPFDILLAADRERPRLLAESGRGDPGSVFTYAVGRLALWSARPGLVDAGTLDRLADVRFRWIAIAEPDVAPYGFAARQALLNLGIWTTIEPRIVKGQSIAQTFASVATGNADLGLVALSEALAYEGPASYAIVPQALYDPIRQDAILLHGGAGNAAATAFLRFLQSPAAARIIERYGYAATVSE
jgi:molybdate transport system substrate-binding protein